jgi:hypothetical protein
MTFTRGGSHGLVLNYGGTERLLLHSKPRRCRGTGWTGVGYLWRVRETFRVWSSQWFPIGTVLVCDDRFDVDCWVVNVEKTILENGLRQEWLDANQPSDNDFQIPLF